MHVSTVVANLAAALDDQGPDIGPSESLFLQVIRLMPAYTEVARLDLWESHVADVVPFVDQPLTATQEALEAIAELGRCNLYGAFDEQRTARRLAEAVACLQDLAVSVPDFSTITEW